MLEPISDNPSQSVDLIKDIPNDNLPSNKTATVTLLQNKYNSEVQDSVASNNSITTRNATKVDASNTLTQIISSRSEQIISAMQSVGLTIPTPTNFHESISSAIKEPNAIFTLNKLWKSCYQSMMTEQNSLQDLSTLEGLEYLKELTTNPDAHINETLNKFFLIDLISHLYTIGVTIDLLYQNNFLTVKNKTELLQRLANHDHTKVFNFNNSTVNESQIKGYILLSKAFSIAKKASINLVNEVKNGALQGSLLQTVICEHVFAESHHPEYFIKDKQAMPLNDILEMICDGFAAGCRPDRYNNIVSITDKFANSEKFWLKRLESGDWSSLENKDQVISLIKQASALIAENCTSTVVETYGEA